MLDLNWNIDDRQQIKHFPLAYLDLQIALKIALQHTDEIEDQLLTTNQQLQQEISRRKQLECYTQVLLDRHEKEKNDLQIILKTLVDHGDAMDKQSYEQLKLWKALSQTDVLTGIANRSHFDQYLKKQWQLMSQKHESLSLMMCDIDFFKEYNDTYGHLAGDACLRRIAYALKSVMRKDTDFVARYGGEEFAIILPYTNQAAATLVAERIMSVLAQLSIPHAGSQICEYVTISVGIATTIPETSVNFSKMIEFADRNLYTAKRQGRQQFISSVILPQSPNLLMSD